MKAFIKFLKKTYFQIIRSIAFYPILISVAFLILSIISVRIDNLQSLVTIKEEINYLFIQDYETARSILSTLIGGIISLTVFSFSMVMVVLSQASSNFSPRLLPSLISNRENQIILGTYVGTLLYCIVILISLGAYGIDSNSLGLSTMFAAIAGVICVGIFVYFIHNISKAIQIHNIINRISNTSKSHANERLNIKEKLKNVPTQDEMNNWPIILSKDSGYYQNFDLDLLDDDMKNKEIKIAVIPYANQHIWKGMPVLRINVKLSRKEIDKLLFCINISSDRHGDDESLGGLVKLMEIAVKAMSPGINDPGTAIDAVNKIGGLLAKFVQCPKFIAESVAESPSVLIRTTIPVEELMRIIVQPIRFYARYDIAVLHELIVALKFVHKTTNLSDANRNIILLELTALRHDLENNITNPIDKKNILNLYNDLPLI